MLHIAESAVWARAQESGVYALPGGVVHGCSSSQLRMVVAAHFPSPEDFVVLSLDESRFVGEVRWVTYRDGGRSESFPHLHGSFPTSAVLEVRPLAEALVELERRRVSSGAPWEASVGYSRAVRVGDRVFVSGTTALGDDGEPAGVGDAGLQAARAIETIAAALAEVGASLGDVVRTRMFVVDIRRDHDAIGRAHAAAFGDVRPAATMVEVSRLIDERMLVEIEVEAVVG